MDVNPPEPCVGPPRRQKSKKQPFGCRKRAKTPNQGGESFHDRHGTQLPTAVVSGAIFPFLEMTDLVLCSTVSKLFASQIRQTPVFNLHLPGKLAALQSSFVHSLRKIRTLRLEPIANATADVRRQVRDAALRILACNANSLTDVNLSGCFQLNCAIADVLASCGSLTQLDLISCDDTEQERCLQRILQSCVTLKSLRVSGGRFLVASQGKGVNSSNMAIGEGDSTRSPKFSSTLLE
jgi:hypothetical protein